MQKIMYGEFTTYCSGLDTARASQGLRLLGGRQLVWLMYQKFRTSRISTSAATAQTFYALQLRNDNIKEYMNRWTQLLSQLGDSHHSVVDYDRKGQLFWEQIKQASITRSMSLSLSWMSLTKVWRSPILIDCGKWPTLHATAERSTRITSITTSLSRRVPRCSVQPVSRKVSADSGSKMEIVLKVTHALTLTLRTRKAHRDRGDPIN